MTEKLLVKPIEYAYMAIEVASEKQASDIVMLNISKVSDFADFFVILTVESVPQMRTLVDDIEVSLKRRGALLHHREGAEGSGWVLLDFGDLIVHIFGSQEREYYQLERLWERALEVVRIQ